MTTRYARPVAAVLLLLVSTAIVVLLEYFIAGAGTLALDEKALIEPATAFFWFAAVAACIVAAFRIRGARLDLLLIGHGLLWLGLRELDFSPLNERDLPIPQTGRLAVTGIAAVLLSAAALRGGLRWQRDFRHAWKRGEQWTREVMWCVGLLAVSRVLENLHGWHDNYDAKFLYNAAEESIEMAVAFLAMLIAARFAPGRVE